MKASAFEFRFRLWISFAMIALGFWAPWLAPLHWERHPTTWLWLGYQLGGLGIASSLAIELVTLMAIAVAAVAAFLRVWGTAYLGTTMVYNAEMKAGRVLADGPYRYVRNPLYLGSFLTIAALSVLMPPSGAAVSLVLLAVFILRLILVEEAFLTPKLGQPYAAYRRAVPRLIPSPWPRVVAGSLKPDWVRALLGEIFPLGVVVSFAALSWQYNSELLAQAMLVSFGLSLVVRALLPAQPGAGQTAS